MSLEMDCILMRLLRALRAFAVIRLVLPILVMACLASQAYAMDVSQQGTTLTVTGTNFRYTWDTRRGGELSIVEQLGTGAGGWWDLGTGRTPSSKWQRVNSTFAWKSLDTIPSLSFSTKRGAYFSGEWNVAYANADKHAALKIIKQSADELIFETQSNPHILENLHAPVPWQVKQIVHVMDSGIIITDVEISLPKDETYELDWASMSVNLDDSLYKEPNPKRQAKFVFGWAYPGQNEYFSNFDKGALQDLPHLPLDIDVMIERTILTEKPLLFGSAAYELTHVKGAGWDGYAEWCLAQANSLLGTKPDFGSYLMIRPKSGMSFVPTNEGSMRNNPCLSAGWNLFDGKTAGLNEPLTYRNTLTFAVGGRKRSSHVEAGTDDRNILLGARIYNAADKMPSADDITAMAADGCDTLILGRKWRADQNAAAAIIKAAHGAGMRVGVTVDVRDMKTLVTDSSWFTRILEKDRDGLLVANVSFLASSIPADEFTLDGQTISFKQDGIDRANAASYALCMRKLRQIVGRGGFLIGEDAAPGPTLLSLAECDLHAARNYDLYRASQPQDGCLMRNRAGAGFAPLVDSLEPDQIGRTAMYGDTPIVSWPARDRTHLAWWALARRLPEKGFRVESDLLPAERRFTISSDDVHGTLFDGGGGEMILLLSADQRSLAQVKLSLNDAKVKTLDGKDVPVKANAFDAGEFEQWQVKGFQISGAKEAGQ